MQTDEAIAQLLAQAEQDARHLTNDMEAHAGIRPMIQEALQELSPLVGEAGAKLCVGTIAHAVSPEKNDPFGGEIPPLPFIYDFVVVTDVFLLVASGYFDPTSGEVEPLATTVRSLNKIVSVTKDAHADDVLVTFADGSSESIPGVEDELSPSGRQRMTELIPALYAAMAV